MPYKKPESVLVLVHTPNFQVLLLERANSPGFWQSVTGSMEENESPVETACRELEEETGLKAPPASLQDWHLSNRFEILPRWRDRYAPGVTHNTEHIFSFCTSAPVQVRLSNAEHSAQCWMEWREAAKRCFSWSNQDAILMLPQRLLISGHSGRQRP